MKINQNFQIDVFGSVILEWQLFLVELETLIKFDQRNDYTFRPVQAPLDS